MPKEIILNLQKHLNVKILTTVLFALGKRLKVTLMSDNRGYEDNPCPPGAHCPVSRHTKKNPINSASPIFRVCTRYRRNSGEGWRVSDRGRNVFPGKRRIQLEKHKQSGGLWCKFQSREAGRSKKVFRAKHLPENSGSFQRG